MRNSIMLSIFVLVVLVACNNVQVSEPNLTLDNVDLTEPIGISAIGAFDDFEESNSILILAEGTVSLMRPGWDRFHLTSFGATLRPGDLVQLDEKASGIVLCSDLSTVLPVAPQAPVGLNSCPIDPEPDINRAGDIYGASRALVDPLIPYVIYPRKTLLLTRNPTLRWNPVPGAISYTVRIDGGDVAWFVETDRTQIFYNNDDLMPGNTYLLSVVADNGRTSREEGTTDIGFMIIDDASRVQIEQGAAHIESLGLPPDSQAYALANLYARNGLLTEAILELEELSNQSVEYGAVRRSLGGLYYETGILGLALENYRQSIHDYSLISDLEGSALAYIGLARTLESLGQLESAYGALDKAITSYESLADSEVIEDLHPWMGQIANRLGEQSLAKGDIEQAMNWMVAAKNHYADAGETNKAAELEERIRELGVSSP